MILPQNSFSIDVKHDNICLKKVCYIIILNLFSPKRYASRIILYLIFLQEIIPYDERTTLAARIPIGTTLRLPPYKSDPPIDYAGGAHLPIYS